MQEPHQSLKGNGITQSLPWVVVLLLGATAWVPYAPIMGPVGQDDLLPVVAVVLGLIVAARLPPARPDPLLWLLFTIVALGSVANLASGFAIDWTVIARGPGRALFYIALLIGLGAIAKSLGGRQLLGILVVCAAIEAVLGLSMWAADLTTPLGVGLFRPGRGSSLFWTSPGRLVATFNLPSGRGMNGLAAYFGLFLPAALALAATGRGMARLWWLAGCALQVAALWLTYTRSTLLTLAAGGLMASLVWRRGLSVGLLAAGVLVLLFSPELVARFFHDSHDRLALIWAAVSLAGDRPWLGHGDIHYNAYLGAESWRMLTPFGPATTTPHNSLALNLFRYGILGALLSATTLTLPALWFWRQARTASAPGRIFAAAGVWAFVAFCLQSLTNNLLEVPKIGIFFWILWVVLQRASDD